MFFSIFIFKCKLIIKTYICHLLILYYKKKTYIRYIIPPYYKKGLLFLNIIIFSTIITLYQLFFLSCTITIFFCTFLDFFLRIILCCLCRIYLELEVTSDNSFKSFIPDSILQLVNT